MKSIGYQATKQLKNCDWIKKPFKSIFAVRSCATENITDKYRQWNFNENGMWTNVDDIKKFANEHGIDLSEWDIHFYMSHERQYNQLTKTWESVEFDVVTIPQPHTIQFIGYDIVPFSTGIFPECSPIVCNGIGNQIKINSNCLLDSFDYAIEIIESDILADTEPGPYRIISVYSL